MSNTTQSYLQRFIRGLLKILLTIIGLFVAAIVFLVLYITTPYFTASVGTWFTHKSGRNVKLEGRLEMHLLQREPRFTLSGIKIGNAEWGKSPLMFEADKIDFTIKPLQLLRGRLVIPELTLEHPIIHLEKNDKGEANWEFTSNPQAQLAKKPLPSGRGDVPIINQLRITDGEMSYDDPKDKINTSLKISTILGSMTNDTANDAIEVHGKGNYQSAPFMLDISAASVLELRESDKPYPFSIHTQIGATSADAKGTTLDPVKMEALDVVLDLKGKNAADLFPITGIALPPTPAYSISGHLTRKGNDWSFDDMKGRLGTSDLKGNILWHPSQKPPYFEGKLVSDNLDMGDLAGLVGGNTTPADTTRVIPDTPLDISRVMAMDADVEFKGRRIKAPALFDNFYMNITLKDGVLTLHPVSFGIADSTVNANIEIEGKQTLPAVSMDVDFRRLSLNALFAPLAKSYGKENVSGGLLGGKIQLKGNGKSLREILASSNGVIGMGMEGGNLSHLLLDLVGLDLFRSAGLLLTGDSPVPMKCVVGDFKVTDGIVGTQAFLVSTDVSNIKGKGTVDLKDEKIDMHLYVYPNEATLLSVQSPLYISGTFKKPSAGVDPKALAARGGAAALLGTFLTPPAALLAFIGPGLGTDSNCAGVIQQMEHDLSTAKSVAPPSKAAAK